MEDEHGLYWYHYGFRFFDPQLGRWNQSDPIGSINPEYSPYNYCFDNPTNFIDPFGLWPWNEDNYIWDPEIGGWALRGFDDTQSYNYSVFIIPNTGFSNGADPDIVIDFARSQAKGMLDYFNEAATIGGLVATFGELSNEQGNMWRGINGK